MYEKEKSLLMAHGCAAATNGLAVQRSADGPTWVAWPHGNQVCLLRLDGDRAETRTVAGRSSDGAHSVMQVRWCELRGTTYLVVAASNGVDFYDEHGASLLFSFPFSQEGGGGSFTRGIATFLGKACVGTSDGSLLVFQRDAAAGAPHLAQRARLHASAICALAGDECHLVSSDQSGNIVQWAGKAGELTKVRQIDHYGSACTGLTLTAQYVVAVYGSGHLRLFSRQTGQVRAEVTAHARWITGLDVALESGLLLTVAEDASVKV
ncbi:WD repeat-containing protein 54-like [Amphibalanus amphitrite]|nr:WD repeat-containing protein 54-like [Amphibalanus amphitrite]XP_043242639.1 WD repeat-containing protein 54-like [Amphibalanus amphitrite]XP_043242640.1 WD repeat-containing protein 54-like [Amphibalanus amphitrite]